MKQVRITPTIVHFMGSCDCNCTSFFKIPQLFIYSSALFAAILLHFIVPAVNPGIESLNYRLLTKTNLVSTTGQLTVLLPTSYFEAIQRSKDRLACNKEMFTMLYNVQESSISLVPDIIFSCTTHFSICHSWLKFVTITSIATP